MTPDRIPRIVHFVFGLRPQDEPFHLVHYLAIDSCRAVLEPDEIHLHCHELPFGFYWDLARPLVTLHRIEPVDAVTTFPYDDPVVAAYTYAHHADFVRLDVLAEHGGMCADIDTLFVAPPREELWRTPCVIGREADARDPRTGEMRASLSNALIMAAPASMFVERWRHRITGALDGTWSAHSCFLAADLAAEAPGQVHIEPERTFHAFAPTRAGLRRLLVNRETDLTDIASIHLAAHLWWEADRHDFLKEVNASVIDEAWIRSGSTTYALAASRFLPEHDYF